MHNNKQFPVMTMTEICAKSSTRLQHAKKFCNTIHKNANSTCEIYIELTVL